MVYRKTATRSVPCGWLGTKRQFVLTVLPAASAYTVWQGRGCEEGRPLFCNAQSVALVMSGRMTARCLMLVKAMCQVGKVFDVGDGNVPSWQGV